LFDDVSIEEAFETWRKQNLLPLTKDEKLIYDWHCANLEFANSTTLDKISLHHWDQVLPFFIVDHQSKAKQNSDRKSTTRSQYLQQLKQFPTD